MTAVVTLYVDYRSPFSYLAKDEAYALERDFHARLIWKPFVTDFEGAYGGGVEERTERHWRKIRYLYMDARRLANRRGLTIYGTRKIFDPTIAHAGMLYSQSQSVFRPYHDRISERFWKRKLDIEDRNAVREVLAAVGADTSSFFDYLARDAIPALHQAQAAAGADGVFGVPTFVFEGELFWGTDRIWLLRERFARRI